MAAAVLAKCNVGAPGQADIRLSDVVVSNRVVQYDLGKTIQDGQFQRTLNSQKPPQAVMIAVAKLRAEHESRPSTVPTIISQMLERNPHMSKYSHPGPNLDSLFDSNFDHVQMMPSCDHCDKTKLLQRPDRSDSNPKIHYGGIASTNQVMKHGKTRDELSKELDTLCFEMEAAGLMNEYPFLIIRGICDYSDSHKNKQWQEYAAATSVAYAKELLCVIEKNETQRTTTDPVASTTSMYHTCSINVPG
jgi:nucleoside phosphorylase